jgi:SAM-dependent methyltransferase
VKGGQKSKKAWNILIRIRYDFTSQKMPMNRLENLRDHLALKPLRQVGGKWYFREVDVAGETTDSFDRLKLAFKKFPRFYYFLIHVVSPVCSDRRPLKRFLESAEGVVLNIGSGNSLRQSGVVNVDMMDYENVDIVCDIHHLPFKDNSIDAVMSMAVLEHVRDPAGVLKEVHRVLKPGGRVFSVIPFMQPFHASPHDYQRYTLPGIEYLHRDFDIVESGVFSGPVSGALWAVQEALASVFSFGSVKLRNLLTIGVMLLTWPVKFLDLLAMRLPTAKNVASTFYFHGTK